MEIGHWLTLGVFIATQLVMGIGVIIATRLDTGILKEQVRAMQEDLSKFGNVLVTLADFRGEINLINERLLAQGKRIDQEIMRRNKRDRSEDDD